MSPNPFEPCTVGLLEIRNRFVRSATFDGTADNFGAASGASEELYRQLGRGGCR